MASELRVENYLTSLLESALPLPPGRRWFGGPARHYYVVIFAPRRRSALCRVEGGRLFAALGPNIFAWIIFVGTSHLDSTRAELLPSCRRRARFPRLSLWLEPARLAVRSWVGAPDCGDRRHHALRQRRST
jgi:hypothetical protein